MDHADSAHEPEMSTSGEADLLHRLREVTDVIWQAARRTSLDALERAIAAGAAGADLGATAARLQGLASEAVAAAEHMRSHLGALEAVAGTIGAAPAREGQALAPTAVGGL